MKGLEIIFKGKKSAIALSSETANLACIVYYTRGTFEIELSNLDKNGICSTWIKDKMESGDQVDIERKDIDYTTNPIVRRKAFSQAYIPLEYSNAEIDEHNKQRLEYFHALQKFLIEEGVIE